MKLLFALFFTSTFTFAQDIDILWQKTIGGNFNDGSNDIVINDAGDIFQIGTSRSDISGDKTEPIIGDRDIWIVKTNAVGEILWDKTIGGTERERSAKAVILANKLYILCTSGSPISGTRTANHYGLDDYWLVCIDMEGNQLWDISYGGDNYDQTTDIKINPAGNIMIGGTSSSNISGNKTDLIGGEADFWVLEINPIDGSILQQKSIGSNTIDSFTAFSFDTEGNIYLFGDSGSNIEKDKTDPGYGDADFWIVKMDSDFNIIADKCFGGSSYENAPIGTSFIYENYLYFAGGSGSDDDGNKTTISLGIMDVWLLKVDLDLNLIWDKSLGGFGYEFPSDLEVKKEQIILTANTEGDISGNKTVNSYGEQDMWLLILDLDGEIQYQNVYGGDGYDYGHFDFDRDDNLIVSCTSASGISGVKTDPSKGDADYWLFKLDMSQYLNINDNELSQSKLIKTYPNPFIDDVRFAFESPIKHQSVLTIYNTQGQMIDQLNVQPNSNNLVWHTTNLASGVYFYEISVDDKLQKGKIIKQ
ncbi:T9SS type A sorting domain-containing protein [Crocinitomix catalasitica]|uniref:T9SS type A sorting domain-containing protein n=1 Tax=Crocinitomix catalasitica TaxID=184607 RepID=UPI0004843C2F|nr:T9SS type A sorting domain-containing protein [Crocinitomix catalasitica]